MLIDEFLSHLEHVKRTGDGWIARCPAHEDNTPSLSITEKGDKILLYCHARCKVEAIVSAVDLKMSDLFQNARTVPNTPKRRIVAAYDYIDAAGTLLYQSVRYQPKTFKQRRPDGKGDWIWNMSGISLVLYRLPRVMKAVSGGESVFIVEGEKDVHTLETLDYTATTNAGGAKKKWRKEYSAALRGAHVIVLPDNDDAGAEHGKQVAQSLYGVAASVKLINLPGLPVKGDVSDWIAARHTGNELIDLVESAPEWKPSATEQKNSPEQLPVIMVTNRPLRDLTAATCNALSKHNNPPTIFARGGRLVRVLGDEWEKPRIEALTTPMAQNVMSAAATYYRENEKRVYHVTPPEELAKALLALGQWPVPPLNGITESPVLRSDWSPLLEAGYDAATGLLYWPSPGFRLPSIPGVPTTEQILDAAAMLTEMIADFPFGEDVASRANALALLLTPLLRPAIAGSIPLAIIDSPQQGCGKTLLAEVTALLVTGRRGVVRPAPSSAEEFRKAITTTLSEGTIIVIFDNIDMRLNDPSLAAVLTADTWSDRILGRTESVSLPNRAVWIATGNNLQVGADLARRSYLIRLDARMARPWTRENYRHPDLLAWVEEQRGCLLAAVFTLVRGWCVAGRPGVKVPALGNFTPWAQNIGAILHYSGIEGFLGNLETFYDQGDDETAQWSNFVDLLRQHFGKEYFTVATLVKSISNLINLAEALPDELIDITRTDIPEGNRRRRIGKALMRIARKTFPNGLRLIRGGDTRDGVATWAVENE